MTKTTKKAEKVRVHSKHRGVTTDLVILETAEALFAKYGFEGVSTKQIATHAGVTIGALYHYFPSKGAVYDEVTDTLFRKMSRLPDSISDSTEPALVKLEALITWFVNLLSSDENFGMILHREIIHPQSSQPQRLITEHFAKPYQMFMTLLNEVVPGEAQEKAFVSTLALCFGFANLKGINIIAPQTADLDLSPQEIGRLAVRLLVNGLREPQPATH